ncbi:hypothetical protein OSB04_003389 [Centaurea solstitialis]|uniref:Chlororespiratory reduction 42 n=1 Tax=Centaurea solstitialis TaxID=347529 RepID=A0AA38U287_9ASTR|nr:hypothetical protein OSB04_003389 [Centaurea solstitialis]
MASSSSLHISITLPLSAATNADKRFHFSHKFSIQFPDRKKCWGIRSNRSLVGGIMSEMRDPSAETGLTPKASTSLQIGSPIIIVEAPKMLKTAASMPCLRANSGLVKAGDVGRIMSRKPKDVWAVRLAIGTYLIDGKYFKPLQLDEDN